MSISPMNAATHDIPGCRSVFAILAQVALATERLSDDEILPQTMDCRLMVIRHDSCLPPENQLWGCHSVASEENLLDSVRRRSSASLRIRTRQCPPFWSAETKRLVTPLHSTGSLCSFSGKPSGILPCSRPTSLPDRKCRDITWT